MKEWYLKKGILSKIKDAYIKSFNIKKFWKNLKINKIDSELKKLVDYYIYSDSLKFSSKYWNKLNIGHLNQINELGIEKFHTSVSNNYFSWRSFNEEFIEGLFNFNKDNKLNNISSEFLLIKHDGLSITQSINYNLISILLYQYLAINNFSYN